MSNTPIVRQRLQFEREFGMYRNWWVRDPRIAGMPVALFLYLHSHEANREVTPADAKRDLGLTDYAWKTAKNTLRRYGFLVEVRDRWPGGSKAPMMRDGAPLRDRRGNPRYVDLAGNLRVRVFTQDPQPGIDHGAEGGVIEVDQPYEEWLERQQELLSADVVAPVFTAPRFSGGGDGTAPRKSTPGEKPQVSTAPRISPRGAPVDDFRNTHIKEEENQDGLVGSNTSSDQPTHQTVSAREAEIDAALAALHPDLRLTFAQLAREVNGRVDLAKVDLVRAVEETVIRAAARGERVGNPAAYAAAVIVRSPEQWAVGADHPAPFEPLGQRLEGSEWEDDAPCARGAHWWGSERLPEIDRGHCELCGTARRAVDPAYAELEAELQAVGGDS